MLKKHFVFDREYFKILAAVALPIAMQNVINHGVSAMDTIMLGELGDIAVSGAKAMWMLSAVLCVYPQWQCLLYPLFLHCLHSFLQSRLCRYFPTKQKLLLQV